jgi:RNA polymerase sigma factor (sigma-70 family)
LETPGRDLEQLALLGHREAWDALIARHTPRVVLALLAIGLPATRARELAGDAWMRLVEQQRRGRIQRLELPGLAIAQARFLALEGNRAEAASHPSLPLDVAESVADPHPTPEDRLLSSEQLGRARDVLATCSRSHERVFRLVYGPRGMSQADVARQLNLSVERVRHILMELRKKLRSAIEEDVDG